MSKNKLYEKNEEVLIVEHYLVRTVAIVSLLYPTVRKTIVVVVTVVVRQHTYKFKVTSCLITVE